MKFCPRNVAFKGTNLGRFLSSHPFAISVRAPHATRLADSISPWRSDEILLALFWVFKAIVAFKGTNPSRFSRLLSCHSRPTAPCRARHPAYRLNFTLTLWRNFVSSVLATFWQRTPACYDWHTDLWHWQLTMTPWKLEGKRRRLYYRPLGSIF